MKEVNVEGFKNICQPNMTDLYKWLSGEMISYYGKNNVIATGTYLFCIGNCSAMLCAHLDTVHKRSPKTFVEAAGKISSPQGIGGDDRCGVYAVLSVLKQIEPSGKKPFLFFSTDEEVGGASTKKAANEVKHLIAPVGFMIELDRANSVDSVYYKCDNKEFKKWIDGYGFKEAQGSFTDICTLCEAWDLAGVNLSVGYYNAHQTIEYVVLDELAATIEKVVKIVSDAKDDCVYTFCKKKEISYYGSGGRFQLFLKGDEVTTKRETSAFMNFALSGSPVRKIPAYEAMDVIDVEKRSIRVSYKGQKYWISDGDVYLSYSCGQCHIK